MARAGGYEFDGHSIYRNSPRRRPVKHWQGCSRAKTQSVHLLANTCNLKSHGRFGFGEAPRVSAPGQGREECTEEDYG